MCFPNTQEKIIFIIIKSKKFLSKETDKSQVSRMCKSHK